MKHQEQLRKLKPQVEASKAEMTGTDEEEEEVGSFRIISSIFKLKKNTTQLEVN